MNRAVTALGAMIALTACGADGGSPGAAEVPGGWVVHDSIELGYHIAHPADWDVAHDSSIAEDVMVGPDGTEIRVAGFVDEDGWPADTLFLGAVADIEQRCGAAPTLVSEFILPDESRVQVYANEYTDGGRRFLLQRAVVLSPPDLWYVDWYSDAGDEGGSRQRFLELLRTFDADPLLPGIQSG